MVLRMARATQHPKTGMYQLRKRVPADVLRLVGGPPVVKFSLGTKDPGQAAVEFRKREAELEARWVEIRKGPQRLDHETVEALGGEVYRSFLARPGKNRSLSVHHGHAGFRWACELLDKAMDIEFMEDWWPRLEALHGHSLDRVLDARGMAVTERTRHDLLLAAHRANRQAVDVILRQVGGDYTPDTGAHRFPELPMAIPAAREPDRKGELDSVWAGWVKEAKPSPNTIKRWRPVLDRMVAFAGTTDLGGIGEAKLQDWIASLLDTLENNTVGKVHLAAAKRIFGYAKTKKLILVDPTRDLSVPSGKRYETKMRSYRDDEAALILGACLEPASDRMSVEHRAARRWVPWLCAYTGARVNEMTQLRRCDVVTIVGRPYLSIVPEAGTVKTGEGRVVPIHPDLIDQGFMTFVSTKSGDEPLFYAASKRRPKGHDGMPPYEEMGTRLSKWVRRLGITDLNIDPNHAWRHRFKTLCKRCGIDMTVADAIQGHAPKTAGGHYGEAEPETMDDAIRKIPRFDPAKFLARSKDADA